MGTRTRVRPETPPARGAGQTRMWRLTAFSGVALLVLITAHMIANHFVVDSVGGLRSYRQVLDYIANPLMFTIESLFLLVVTLHAMLGLRGVLFDLTGDRRRRAWIDRGVAVLGVLTVAYGFFLVGTLASRA
jgi:succinate dehydrogenase hydrophobic anchor subunit